MKKLANQIWEIRTVRVVVRVLEVVLLLFILTYFYDHSKADSKEQLGHWKEILAVRGMIIGYIGMKLLFPFVSLRKMFIKERIEITDALSLIAASILYLAVVGGTIIGILLGV